MKFTPDKLPIYGETLESLGQRLSEQPGADAIDPNVVGVELLGQALAQADDATFGCTVCRIAGLLKIHT